MNYRHAYHAGNFSDVFKHIVLIALLKSFAHKETAFCYLDTHAGAGKYDLNSPTARKTQEFNNGITPLLTKHVVSPLINDYLTCVKSYGAPAFYPGSPLIAQAFLRPQDRMVLSELHPEELSALKKTFPRNKQVAIHQLDGYQSLKAFLPPKERRGLILIDPPYEDKTEFDRLLATLPLALTRFATGIYALWYPIKNSATTDRFCNALKAKLKQPILKAELSIYSEQTSLGLNGSGLLIINPPWKLEQQLNIALAELSEHLAIRIFSHNSLYSCTYLRRPL